ncbi:NAD-dependent epimerase/dehydratase family protein [Roseomonas sp. CECT 9278]|uniref:NAD-dependent epimerase/dehydratase family protein n=1 Tax=Roseomonas sp. CECT 9278 TaxID=2845823 RepID=UPI001E301CD7|nr:NAD-dependent epimerase/dehydratase family protein [Roseomonas sp. CECT 9278]CAH0229725.1 ADP-L-glycero-D-manno-heptose-6-epimerase [Roseomonas sp. CECT 9278]
MTVLLTGAAGFIGMHVAEALMARGDDVIGIDNLNAYYDVRLKRARLARLEARAGFRFLEADVADREAMLGLAERHAGVTRIVHLAAQPGVRHSLVDPYAYVQSNVMGHLVVLELARRLRRLEHLVYASSSSVYGANRDLPFAEADRVDHPVSLYAATKRSGELISESYAHLFGLPQTGLRFFTVYGPWGRPDMAPWMFAEAILSGRPVTLYDGGRLKRDFTFVDDIAAGVQGCLDHPPEGTAPRVLNIGNNRSVEVRRFVEVLEGALGRRAIVVDTPRPATDVAETFADISAIQALCGFAPRTPIEVGIPRFAEWYLSWREGG